MVDIRDFEESFVIHFGVEGTRVNAYTLASSLVAIADAAKSANSVLNPGYEIEVLVEAVGSGSFKAKIRALYHGSGNLFSKSDLRAIVMSVIAAYIYTHTLDPGPDVQVVVNTDEVVIEYGSKRIIVPRDVHEATQRVAQAPEFREGVSRAFQSLENDPDVHYVAISPSMEEKTPPDRIPRDQFRAISAGVLLEQAGTREFVETTDLQITRAILERGRKRWQFVWRGVRISAPVSDDRFFEKFFAREITIAPGDALRVRLRVRQLLDADTGVYVNDTNGYEVLEVLSHFPRGMQTSARLGPG
jgi:hypothetical protein